MKYFQEFDPLHPIRYDETLQVKNRKIHLSYIPLVDSVSIKGFLQAQTPSDVNSNSFWCDYRFDDGYRSSNAEIIFDSSANDRFLEISYLGIGTVLRAEDMNEVAESLNSLDQTRQESRADIENLKIRVNVFNENAQESLQNHNQNSAAHPQFRQSLQATQSELETRLGTFNARINGIQNQISSYNDSVQSQFLNLISIFEDSLQSIEVQLSNQIEMSINSLDDYRDEFTGIYNSIERLGSEFQSDRESTIAQIESILAVERKSYSTTINNAKSEAISRSLAESERINNSLKAILESKIDSESAARSNFQTQIESKFDSLESAFNSLPARIDSETYSRIQSDNEIRGLIVTYRDDSDAQIDSITSNVANLANTLYQARQATNTQIESLRANIAIAEDRMVITANQLESLTATNKTLTESLNAGIDEIDSLKNSMEEYVESQFEPIKTDFAHSLANFDSIFTDSLHSTNDSLDSLQSSITTREFNVDQYFANIESSVGAIWDEFNINADSIQANAVGIVANSEAFIALREACTDEFGSISTSIEDLSDHIESIDTSIGDIESEFMDTRIEFIKVFSSIDSSIEGLNEYDIRLSSSISGIDSRATNIQTSLGNTNTSVGTINTSLKTANTNITNAQTSIGNLSKYDSSLQASIGNANTSIGNLNTKATNIQTSLGNTNTSLNNVTTRVSNLESKHNPFTLGTTSSTVNGAIWYVS